MSDPRQLVAAINAARDAFEYVGTGPPQYENEVRQDEEWTIQLTKACRYLASVRALRGVDGFNGAVIELCFGASERTLEAYLLRFTDDDLADYRDHDTVYVRAADQGLFERRTAEDLRQLYDRNRTEHYYGRFVPTQQKEDAMFELAERLHGYVIDQFRDESVCLCG